MLRPAVWMKRLSSAPHECSADAFEPVQAPAVRAKAATAAKRPSRRSPPSSGRDGGRTMTRTGDPRSRRGDPLREDERAVHDRPPHPDRVVEGDGRGVLGPHEQTDGGRPLQEESAKILEASPCIPETPALRINPDLLELYGPFRPRRRLCLEEDFVIFPPDPASPLLDLYARAPLEESRVTRIGVDAHLLEVGRCGRTDEHIEVGKLGRPQPACSELRRFLEDVDRLPRTIVESLGHPVAKDGPEAGDRCLLPDHHPRVSP